MGGDVSSDFNAVESANDHLEHLSSAREWVIANFDVDKMADQIKKYRELIKIQEEHIRRYEEEYRFLNETYLDNLDFVVSAIEWGSIESLYKSIILAIKTGSIFAKGYSDPASLSKRDSLLFRSQSLFWNKKGISDTRKQQLNKMSYADYLGTHEWQWIRSAALIRGNGECSICGSNSNLNVHHKRYPKRGNEQSADLVVLCNGCHNKFHDKFGRGKQ